MIIVGAGAAGIGCAVSLTGGFGLDPSRVLLLERGEEVGTSINGSFRPDKMRFISPSFNRGGMASSFDLNSAVAHTLPHDQHDAEPPGPQYADHMDELFELARLRDRVLRHSEIVEIVKAPGDGIIDVHVRIRAGAGGDAEEVQSVTVETLRTRYVVWAAADFTLLRRVHAIGAVG